MKHDEHGVPEHESGIKISAENAIELGNEPEAAGLFSVLKERLLDINHWHEMAGDAGATFQVVDKEGKEVNRPVQEGDYFKINIPGPGSAAGEGYDWAKVEEISERKESGSESLAIRVRPTASPQSNSKDIAHFYSEEATSTFKIMREGKRIKAAIHDRNTKANTDTHILTDKVRNAVVAAGALTAFSKIQWKSLVNGILKT